jgi:hypothetical protein
VYTKSNRGGPRISRKSQRQRSELQHESASPISSEQSSQDDSSFDDHFITSMINPGAGLKAANNDSTNIDEIFESIFGTKAEQPDSPNVRVYGSDKAM